MAWEEVVTARGPGSLNNSGKLFMEHALFIHRLGIKDGVKDVEEEKDKKQWMSKSCAWGKDWNWPFLTQLGRNGEKKNRHTESLRESLYKANQ